MKSRHRHTEDNAHRDALTQRSQLMNVACLDHSSTDLTLTYEGTQPPYPSKYLVA